MNQAILFNDDLHFSEQHNAWCFTGMHRGEQISVLIAERYHSAKQSISDTIKFDWEALAEDWLADDEPDEKGYIWLKLD